MTSKQEIIQKALEDNIDRIRGSIEPLELKKEIIFDAGASQKQKEIAIKLKTILDNFYSPNNYLLDNVFDDLKDLAKELSK